MAENCKIPWVCLGFFDMFLFGWGWLVCLFILLCVFGLVFCLIFVLFFFFS